jgi:hypothetical protein
MKTLFSTYGIAPAKAVLNLYTNGTENVNWEKGIDEVTGLDVGVNSRTLTEGVDFATIQIVSEPNVGATSELAYVTNATVDVTDYTNVYVDWEAVSAGEYALIVDDVRAGGIATFDARALYGTGTGRKTTSLSISALSGGKYIRVNSLTDVLAPDTANTTIRIHRVWLEQ